MSVPDVPGRRDQKSIDEADNDRVERNPDPAVDQEHELPDEWHQRPIPGRVPDE